MLICKPGMTVRINPNDYTEQMLKNCTLFVQEIIEEENRAICTIIYNKGATIKESHPNSYGILTHQCTVRYLKNELAGFTFKINTNILEEIKQ